MKRTLLFLFTFCLFVEGIPISAQTGPETYVWPKDPEVLKNLKKWQGYKFGLLIHMGLYSELGTVESWGLCPEEWVTRNVDDYYQYATNYRNTKFKFNPVNFDPAKWAGLFKRSGARYMIYSSKHHDGFCLFDTKYTDFKVTD
jgi:alpha-L-fucosidase